jgi:hypothetical protein
MKVETKTPISNMLQIDWKTYLAACKDKTVGNKDTSVFTELGCIELTSPSF